MYNNIVVLNSRSCSIYEYDYYIQNRKSEIMISTALLQKL